MHSKWRLITYSHLVLGLPKFYQDLLHWQCLWSLWLQWYNNVIQVPCIVLKFPRAYMFRLIPSPYSHVAFQKGAHFSHLPVCWKLRSGSRGMRYAHYDHYIAYITNCFMRADSASTVRSGASTLSWWALPMWYREPAPLETCMILCWEEDVSNNVRVKLNEGTDPGASAHRCEGLTISTWPTIIATVLLLKIWPF